MSRGIPIIAGGRGGRFPRPSAPAISGITELSVGETTAVIAWTTDIAGTSQIEYGTTTSYGSSTTLSETLTTAHQQTITGLSNSTTYHYRVITRANGRTTYSGDGDFETGSGSPCVISNVVEELVSDDSATITWDTDLPATSQIEYGTTVEYGSTTTLNSDLETSHSETISGLESETTYHYRVVSVANGQTTNGDDGTFTTTAEPVVSEIPRGMWDTFTAHRDAENWAGSGVLYLPTGGYAQLADASVTDLDYSQDFSIEVATLVEAYQYLPVNTALFGKKQYTYNHTAGFAIYGNTPQVRSFGKRFSAKVSDGTYSATANAANYVQGPCHIVVTWDRSEKTVTIYVNGEADGSGSSSSLVPASIENSQVLKFGASLSNVFAARLWNRLLSSAEVTALHAEFAAHSNSTPTGFDRTSLVSEWLMTEACAADGSAGTTHIKDNVGTNHLELLSNAELLSGAGDLAWVAPADEATDVETACFFEASGGEAELTTPSLPLQYYFQLDTAATFDTANLRESDWVPRYAMWKPLLKPATTYYARVKCRDKAENESDYTTAVSFTTRAAKTWYVRPGSFTTSQLSDATRQPDTGVYGDQDGSSYANAWNGFTSIVFGTDGVSPGDTLYVCGTHVHECITVNYISSQGIQLISESGIDDNCWITIRMDYATDPGYVWKAYWDNRAAVTWTGPDANGVYSTTGLSYGVSAEYVDGVYTKLHPQTATTWTDDLGHYYNGSGTRYVKLTDGSDPTGKVLSPTNGYYFNLGRSSYVRFVGCNFRATVDVTRYDECNSNMPCSHHIQFTDCNLMHCGIPLYNSNHDWTIDGCEISWNADAVYLIYQAGPIAHRLTVRGCHIHHIGRPDFPGTDEHAVGIQCGDDHLVEYNELNNCGSAIEPWTSSYSMKNGTIRYNYIHDVHVATTSGQGIAISGSTSSVEGLRTGWEVYGNIIANVGINGTVGYQGIGISTNFNDYVHIYNNIIYTTLNSGIRCIPVGGSANSFADVDHNIIVEAKATEYVYIKAATDDSGTLIRDNVYYDLTSTPDNYLYPGDAVETDNETADPKFASFPPTQLAHFALQVDSPAWDHGWERIPIEDIGL